ncbi:MAG: alpha-N-arabinofuranosidase [Acidobacteriota bacterium]|nr:alpha-N-arabinofuranosidase [Acidobacteriota bacterium]
MRSLCCALVQLALLSTTSLLVAQGPAAQPVKLAIDAAHAKGNVSPMLYGLMTEEINFSYDGGLYAELVRNRTLQDGNGPSHWFLHEGDAPAATMKIDKTTGPSTALPVSLRLEVPAGPALRDLPAVENEGYWGIPMRAQTQYTGSFYAKSDGPQSVTASVVNNTTGAVLATATVAVQGGWQRYSFQLKTGAIQASANNRLRLAVSKPGTTWFTLVSLFPPTYHDRANGFRADLMEKLAAMHPAFLRLPGGNYLEGDHINERFDWKKTIGPFVDRPTHPSPWRYHSSDGMGLLEFLEWCEDLKMQPVLAVYAGYSLRGDYVKPGTDLEPYVQDALDEIEYVTGSANTRWGAERVKDGHPEPFALQYVEIGNEDWFDKSGSYEGRYAQFYKAIKAQYPQLQLIATTPVKQTRPDVVDDHYYRTARQFFDDVHHYDNTDRNGPKIFVGEWATREGSPTPNFGAALGDSAWMTGMERNSDLIVMSSYAPLLVNVNPGGMQWETDLIGYDAMQSYGSPAYYAQVMFSNHVGNEILPVVQTGDAPRLFYSVTRRASDGTVIVKLVNASSQPQKVQLALDGVSHVSPSAKLLTLSARTTAATNTLTSPRTVEPVESAISNAAPRFTHTMPAYSIQVLELKTK